MSHKIDKGLGLKGIDITQTGFNDRVIKAIADSTSKSLLESAVYGTSFEESLRNNLRGQLVGVISQEAFRGIVKDLDGETLGDNIAHKIAAGITGCLSAKASGHACDAGVIGATIGEMWGDWITDDPNELTPAQKETIINQAKLIAGIGAAFAGEDVNAAADMAAEAVRWNGLKGKEIKDFYDQYDKYCSAGPSTSCTSTINEWKRASYKHASMTSQEITVWEDGITTMIEHYKKQCKSDSCHKHLRSQKYRYMIEYAGNPAIFYQLESTLVTYIHGPFANIQMVGAHLAGSLVEAYNVVSRNSIKQNRPTINITKPKKPLDDAIRTSIRRFELTGQKPNAVLYRQDNDGTITSYAVYDSKGMILKRVDMKGAAHGGVPTPHVIEYGRNYLPNGEIKVHRPRGNPRPARPDEIQYIKED
ncbi:MAG: polymorphic toxin type 24 domain-containing protein [Moraxella sp.]|nr:polymorphic toxin type 24 domain-containing protein [Moraxella sp.]